MEGQQYEEHVPQNEIYRMEFRGDGSTYFRIWIVNVVLTILTFGIFSAWATVRSRKYLYQNTYLAGSNFDYHAEPLQILVGRVIVGALMGLYFFGSHLSIYVPLVAGIIIVVMIPWLVVRSLIFNLSQSSYRGIRFGFSKCYQLSYRRFALAALVSIFTLGLGTPIAMYFLADLKLNNAWLGQRKFSFTAGPELFFKGVYGASAAGGLGMLIFGLVGYFLGRMVFGSLETFGIVTIPQVEPMIGIILGYAGALIIGRTVYDYIVYNGILRALRNEALSGHGGLELSELGWRYLKMGVLSILTLGLYLPWGMMEVLRYKISTTSFDGPEGTLDTFTQRKAESGGAIAEAATTLWDIDIGI